jgi:hypothetical protein
MADNIFESVGFDKSLEDVFQRIRAIIESPDGCNAGVYKPVRMSQARAAHILPGAEGRKKAQQVFAEIRPRRSSIQVARRRNARSRNPGARWEITIDRNFSDWHDL